MSSAPSALLTRAAGCFGFAAVALGAFGAHALQATLAELGTTKIWEVAVLYHLVHSLAALWASDRRPTAALFWLLGILIFSGSLYILALSNLRWMGAITPVGGILLLAGWATVVLGRRAEKLKSTINHRG